MYGPLAPKAQNERIMGESCLVVCPQNASLTPINGIGLRFISGYTSEGGVLI